MGEKKRKCMFLICLIFQYLWIHNILGSSSFRVDKEIVWFADHMIAQVNQKRIKVIKAEKKNSRVKFLENESNVYFHNLRSAFLGEKRLIKNIFFNYCNSFGY